MMRRVVATLAAIASILFVLGGCSSPFSNSPTVYDLLDNPDLYNGKQVTVLGHYLWKPGEPHDLSVLVLGVSTTDAGTDAQPLGEPIWLSGFPEEVKAALHMPGDAVYGVVEVTGKFEQGGSYGPDGSYNRQLTVSGARAIEEVERVRVTVPEDVPDGVIPLSQLLNSPERYNGQHVTTRGYYFWSPATAGVLATGVESEKAEGVVDPTTAEAGINPRPIKPMIALDGFPPELSKELHIGPGNSFVWGLVEVSGLFEANGSWGVDGSLHQHLQIEQPDQVKTLQD